MKSCSESGAFFIPLAVGLLVLLGVTFYSLDMAILYKARNQLQTATDAALTRALQLTADKPSADRGRLDEIEYMAELAAIDNLDPVAGELNLRDWDADSANVPVTVSIDTETHYVTAAGSIEVNTWIYDLLSGDDWSNVVGATAEGSRKHLIVALLLDSSQSMDLVSDNCRTCNSNETEFLTYNPTAFIRASYNWNRLRIQSNDAITELPSIFLRGDYPGDTGPEEESNPDSTGVENGNENEPRDVDSGHGTICHIPPGNPANRRTLRVGAPAVSAHLAHGDYLGNCVVSCQDQGLCDGLSKLQVMKLAALNFIASYKEKVDSLIVIEFSDTARQIEETEINGIIASGGTDLSQAINLAVATMGEERLQLGGDAYLQMVILTDGVSGNGPRDQTCMVDQSNTTRFDRAPYMIQLINQTDTLRLDPGIRFYVVGIGTESEIVVDRFQDRFDNDLVKPIFLRRLANDPAGWSDEPFVCPINSYEDMDGILPGEYVNADHNTLTPILLKIGENLLTRIVK